MKHPKTHINQIQFSSVQLLSHVQLFVTPWTVAHHAPLSMGIPRQESWSGLPVPSPGDLPGPRIEPRSPASPALQADSLSQRHWESPFLSVQFSTISVKYINYYCAVNLQNSL